MKICPRCKKEFECLEGNCWCEKIKISNNKLKKIRNKYDSCLCKNCLKDFEN